MSETKPLKKMSLGYMGCKGNLAVKESKQMFMARVAGVIQGSQHKEKRDGTLNSYFVGEFVGTTADGSNWTSDVLYLPGFLHEKLDSAFKAGGEAPLKFGYDIFSQPNEKSSVGFGYVAVTVIKTETSDVLRQLRDEMSTVPLPGAATDTAEEKPAKARKAN
jgi:hypothetical protein